ncbi:MAG: 4Fe-4S binding protein, partial [Gammaproteobacteria bacterium]|nr:4Fe-4S binding protein [Gammaproteobacteria bacterium]
GSVRSIRASLAGVSGYLGQFSVKGRVAGEQVDIAPSLLTAHKPFDIVLDLGHPAQLECEVLPPGYYAPGSDGGALERALEEIPALVGEFEKPRYFDYNPDICAHGASHITGCSRCIDACPTLAIASVGEQIEVNPYLCQGGGGCATACPSGAITYAFPLAGDLLTSLRTVLIGYRESGGLAAQVLFYDGEAGREWLRQHAGALPENVIPCEVEEIGAVGMEVWLCVLAYGAAGVGLLCLPGTPPSVRRELEEQRGFAAAILAGMGHDPGLIRLLDSSDEAGSMAALQTPAEQQPRDAATFRPQNEKRTNIRLAVEHLYEQADTPPPESRDGRV